MKTKMKSKLTPLVFLGIALCSFYQEPVHAGYSSYPPSQVNGYNFFEDSDNAVNALHCAQGLDAICVSGSFLPRGIKLAVNQNGVPMLVQGLFFNKQNPSLNYVTYNITLEPDYYGSEKSVELYKEYLAAKYGVMIKNVTVSPTNISGTQFIVRKTFKPYQQPEGRTPSAPSGTPPSGSSIALHTVFTDTMAPAWTGDFHNIGSRFSVNINGRIMDLEPGLQKMILNKAGNGVIGQVSFSFPVKATTFDASITCNVKLFQETFRSTIKSWAITRVSRPGYSHESFNNDEKNAIRASIRVEDFCDVKQFVDVTHLPLSKLEARKEQLFNQLFDSAFKKVMDSAPPGTIGGADPKYTYLEQIASMDAQGLLSLHFKDEEVFNLSSDLDFYAGGVTEDNLAPAHRQLCEGYQKFDKPSASCQTVCDPNSEIYRPKDPLAGSDGCLYVNEASFRSGYVF